MAIPAQYTQAARPKSAEERFADRWERTPMSRRNRRTGSGLERWHIVSQMDPQSGKWEPIGATRAVSAREALRRFQKARRYHYKLHFESLGGPWQCAAATIDGARFAAFLAPPEGMDRMTAYLDSGEWTPAKT